MDWKNLKFYGLKGFIIYVRVHVIIKNLFMSFNSKHGSPNEDINRLGRRKTTEVMFGNYGLHIRTPVGNLTTLYLKNLSFFAPDL